MKVIRSTKCSTKFANQKKLNDLHIILSEYANVVNFFIEYFWGKEKVDKGKLLKPIVDLPIETTWLSARLRKVAAREAIDMILAVRERWKKKPEKIQKPLHRGDRMCCSSTIAELQESESSFDCFLRITSVGNKMKLELPIKKHKHFNKWESQGKRLNSYIITKDYIQFVFEIETGEKKKEGKTLGIDTGIKCLATTSEGQRIGEEIESIIESIKRCRQNSKRQKRLRKYLKHYINSCAIQVFEQNPRLCRVVVERLKNMNLKTKENKKLSKNIRKSIGNWNYRYWLDRLQRECETRRSRFTSCAPVNTSITCNSCGHTDRTNRSKQELFCCVKCGHTAHADHNAAKNILDRGVSLVYRRGK